MTTARRTEIGLIYEGVDISADLRPHLLDLSYTDTLGGESDDVQITIEDSAAIWSTEWRPEEGDTHTAWIDAPSDIAGDVRRLDIGRVRVDEIDESGPPSAVRIKAVSAGLSVGLARTRRSRAWREASLQVIAEDIAARAGLRLVFAAPDPAYRRRNPPRPAPPPARPAQTPAEQAQLADRYGAEILARAAATPKARGGPRYDRVDQRSETDLIFLRRLCGDYGLTLKVTDGAIAIFLESDLESAPALARYRLGQEAIIRYHVTRSSADRYESCTVRYRDPVSGRMYEATHPAPARGEQPAEPNLAVTRRVESQGDAEQLAADMLRDRNARGQTGTLLLAGDPALYAGATIDVEARTMTGRYLVTRAGHSTGGGYTTTLSVRRILDADGRPA